MSQTGLIPFAFGASIGVVAIVAMVLQPAIAQEQNKRIAIVQLGNALKTAGVKLEEDKFLTLDTDTVQPRADSRNLHWELFQTGQRINAYLTQNGASRSVKLTGSSQDYWCQVALLESFAKANAGKFKVHHSYYQMELPKWKPDMVEQLQALSVPDDCKYT